MNRKILAALAVPAAVLLLAACNPGNSSGQQQENQQQSQDEQTYEQVQPIPHFPYSVYREVGIDVEADQALGLQTTSFFFNQGVADPVLECPSLGQPFPNTASLSNPNQVVYRPNSSRDDAGVATGQMDPNGIYNPEASSGTYVLCINAAGQKYLQYWEGFVDTVSGAARWDGGSHQIVVMGQPVMPRCAPGTSKGHKATLCTKP